MKSGTQLWLTTYRKVLIFSGTAAVLAFGFIIWVLLSPTANPVPPSIKSQVKFSIIYPDSYSIDPSSWKYTASQDNLAFKAQKSDYSVVFTEEKVPLEFQDDAAAYNRFVGSLRPFANIKTALGTVSLTNVVTAGSFQPYGQTALLNTHGSLILAHPSRNLTDDEWRNLCSSLKLS